MSQSSPLTSMVCSGCACLCDDIDLVLENGRIRSIHNVCRWGVARFTGRKKFSDRHPRRLLPPALIRDHGGCARSVDLQDAIDKTLELMGNSRRIVVYGLCQMSQEAFDPLFDLVKDRQTLFVPSEGGLWTRYMDLLGRRPLALTTLEAIRNQADFVLFWGANPTHSCPRLVSRYAIHARGHFTERGMEDRRAFTVDIQETEMGRMSNLIVVDADHELTLARFLLKLSNGDEIVPPSFSPKKVLRKLTEAMATTQYRAIFVGRGPFYGHSGKETLEQLVELAEAMNRKAPCFLMPLATDFNTVGFYGAFWRRQGPNNPHWRIIEDLRDWQPETGDLLLSVSGDCLWFMTDEQKVKLHTEAVPIVSISAYESMTTATADVAMGVGVLGVDVAGSAVRLDGVCMPLSAAARSNRSSDAEILGRMCL